MFLAIHNSKSSSLDLDLPKVTKMAFTPAQWRTLLVPWRHHIRHITVYSESAHFKIFDPRLQPTKWREFVQRNREMLELLHTLAVVERISWFDMIKTLNSRRQAWRERQLPSSEDYGEDEDEDEASFYILVGHDVLNVEELDVAKLAAFFSAFDERSMRAEFRDVILKIYAELTAEERLHLDQKRQIRVGLEFPM